MTEILYETERLRVRDWRDVDLPFLRAMCADPDVMRYFPSVLTPAETDAFAARIRAARRADGIGFPALELKATGARIDLAGLPEDVRGRIAEGGCPLGRILIRTNLLREVELLALWRIAPAALLSEQLSVPPEGVV